MTLVPGRTGRAPLALLAVAAIAMGLAASDVRAAEPRDYAYLFFQGKVTNTDGSRAAPSRPWSRSTTS